METSVGTTTFRAVKPRAAIMLEWAARVQNHVIGGRYMNENTMKTLSNAIYDDWSFLVTAITSLSKPFLDVDSLMSVYDGSESYSMLDRDGVDADVLRGIEADLTALESGAPDQTLRHISALKAYIAYLRDDMSAMARHLFDAKNYDDEDPFVTVVDTLRIMTKHVQAEQQWMRSWENKISHDVLDLKGDLANLSLRNNLPDKDYMNRQADQMSASMSAFKPVSVR